MPSLLTGRRDPRNRRRSSCLPGLARPRPCWRCSAQLGSSAFSSSCRRTRCGLRLPTSSRPSVSCRNLGLSRRSAPTDRRPDPSTPLATTRCRGPPSPQLCNVVDRHPGRPSGFLRGRDVELSVMAAHISSSTKPTTLRPRRGERSATTFVGRPVVQFTATSVSGGRPASWWQGPLLVPARRSPTTGLFRRRSISAPYWISATMTERSPRRLSNGCGQTWPRVWIT